MGGGVYARKGLYKSVGVYSSGKVSLFTLKEHKRLNIFKQIVCIKNCCAILLDH